MSFSRISGIAALGFAIMIVLSNVIAVPAGLPAHRCRDRRGQRVLQHQGRRRRHRVRAHSRRLGAGHVVRRGRGRRAVAVRARPGRGVVTARIRRPGPAERHLRRGHRDPPRARARRRRDPALWALHDALFTLNGTFLALALIGLSISGLRAGLIRPWHGTLGLLSAALLFSSATLTPLVIDHAGPFGLLGLVGWLMWVAWIVAYGITLIRLNPASPVRRSSQWPCCCCPVHLPRGDPGGRAESP